MWLNRCTILSSLNITLILTWMHSWVDETERRRREDEERSVRKVGSGRFHGSNRAADGSERHEILMEWKTNWSWCNVERKWKRNTTKVSQDTKRDGKRGKYQKMYQKGEQKTPKEEANERVEKERERENGSQWSTPLCPSRFHAKQNTATCHSFTLFIHYIHNLIVSTDSLIILLIHMESNSINGKLKGLVVIDTLVQIIHCRGLIKVEPCQQRCETWMHDLWLSGTFQVSVS